MTEEYSTRISNVLAQNLDLRDPTNVPTWDALFAPTLNLSLAGYVAGRYWLRDLGSGMAMGIEGKVNLRWYPISPATLLSYTASTVITKRRLVQLAAPNNVAAMTMLGAAYQGLALNDAQPGQLVYVLLDGSFWCEVGAVPAVIKDPVVSDAAGRAIAGVAGNFYAGIAVSGVTAIDGVNCQLITVCGVPTALS